MRADLPPRLTEKVKEILLEMEQSEEGKKVMKTYSKTTKFDEFPPHSLDAMNKLMQFVDAEINLK